MKTGFDFMLSAPPRVTEEMLAREEEKRLRRKYAALLSIASSLSSAAALALCAALYASSRPAGVAAFALWGAGFAASALLTFIFVNRKDIIS